MAEVRRLTHYTINSKLTTERQGYNAQSSNNVKITCSHFHQRYIKLQTHLGKPTSEELMQEKGVS